MACPCVLQVALTEALAPFGEICCCSFTGRALLDQFLNIILKSPFATYLEILIWGFKRLKPIDSPKLFWRDLRHRCVSYCQCLSLEGSVAVLYVHWVCAAFFLTTIVMLCADVLTPEQLITVLDEFKEVLHWSKGHQWVA